MNRKIIFFIALFYFLTFVVAFVMAEDLQELEKQLEASRKATEEDLAELEKSSEDPFLEEILEEEETPPPVVAVPPVTEEKEEIPELSEFEEESETVLPDDPAEKAKEDEARVEENNKVVLEEVSLKESPQSWGLTMMGGTYRPLRYQGRGTSLFNDIYQGKGWFLNDRGLWGDLALEWQFFRLFGTLAAKASTGLWYIEANHDPRSVAGTNTRRYSLWAIPATLTGVYRLHFWSNQPIIPFAEGGGGYVTLNQSAAREDEYRNISRRVYVAGIGVQINGNILDPKAARSFDINWGVNRTHFIAQYRIIRNLTKDVFDFSGQDLITAGLLFEF